jgi:hypothetical protein
MTLGAGGVDDEHFSDIDAKFGLGFSRLQE